MQDFSKYSFEELCEKKQKKEIDISWDTIDKIFDLKPDQARQKWKRIRKKENKLPKREEIINEELNNKLKNIDLEFMNLYKEKQKIRDHKRELNRLLREDARFEEFLEEIKYSIETIEVPKFKEYEHKDGTKVGILGISDIHFGKIFSSINNSYSVQICFDRMNDLLSEVVDWIEDRNISYLHVINASDSVEGLLRISQIRVLEMGVIDSTIEFSKMMAEWLNQLSKYIDITYHHIISANHSEVRWFNQKAGQFPDEDLEKVIIQMISGLLKDNSHIKVPIYDKDYALLNINNKNILIYHGHQFGSKKLSDVVKELQLLHGMEIDCLITGHKHHEEIITIGENSKGNIKVIMLPAIMGSDNFSDQLFTGSKAGATLIEFNSNKKGLTTTEIILN